MSIAIMFFAGWLIGLWCGKKDWPYFRDRLQRLMNK